MEGWEMSGLDDLRDYADDWPGLRRAVAAVEDDLRAVQAVADERYPAWEWVEAHGGLDQVRLDYSEGVRFGNIVDDVAKLLGISTEGLDSQDARERLRAALDRRLTPEGMEWPRDVKGVPIVRGETVWANGGGKGDGRAWYVRRVCPGSAYPVDAEDGKGERRDLKPEWLTHERPAPKVLDVEGAEIRAGDEVWDKSSGDRLTAVAIEDGGHTIICRYADIEGSAIPTHGLWSPCELTHRAPVIAADGRPLREGETVWHTSSGAEYTVRSVTRGGAHLSKGDKPGGYCRAEYLTHERPDSRDRIEEDARLKPSEYADRYHIGRIGFEAEDMRVDLVRRCKEMAEKGETK